MDKPQYKYEIVAGTLQEELKTERDALVEYTNDVTIVQQNTMTDATSTSSSSRTVLYVVACTVNLASLACGIASGWTSPEIPKFKEEDNPLGVTISKTEEGWLGSFLPMGAMLGPLLGGLAADKIGRKKTLILGNLPFVVAFLINIVATDINLLFFGRFISGVATGLTFTVVPMYVGEIAEDDIRGLLGSFMTLFICAGFLFSYVVGPFVSIRLFNIACLACPVLFLILFTIFNPESPYYSIQKQNITGAEESLIKLRRKSKDAVQKELELIKVNVEEAQADKCNFFQIFKSKGLTRGLLLAMTLVSFQQLSGVNVILFYAQDIFTDAGVSLPPAICTIILGILLTVACGGSSVLVERQGKRFLLLLSGIGMTVSQGALAYFFYLKDDQKSDVSAISWLPIVCLLIFIVTYCLGFGPLPWAVMGEIFPPNIKSIASTATATICWILAFLLTKYFGYVADIIGKSGSFGVFAVFCLLSIAFVFKFMPETSGKSLQEIQDILNGNIKNEV